MITFEDNQFRPSRLYLLLDDKLIVKNKQTAGIILRYHKDESKPLKMNEEYRFTTKLGQNQLRSNEAVAQVLVFKNANARLKFQDKEETESLNVKSEQRFNQNSDSENDESYSAGFAALPQRKPKQRIVRHGSTADTSSTRYTTGFRENQSNASEICEQVTFEKRERKGSDPLIQIRTQYPKFQRQSKKVPFWEQVSNQIIKEDQLGFVIPQQLQANQKIAKYVMEYLQDEFNLQ